MVGSTTKYLIDFKDTGSPNSDPLLILGHADNIDSQGRWLPRLPVITWLYRPIHDHKNYPILLLIIAKTQMSRKCQLILIGRQSKKTRKRRTAERRQCQHRRSCVCNRRVGVPTPM